MPPPVQCSALPQRLVEPLDDWLADLKLSDSLDAWLSVLMMLMQFIAASVVFAFTPCVCYALL